MLEMILQFLSEAFTMPTAIFSGLMCLVILNTVSSLFGVSMDSMDAADGLTDGLLDGAADGLVDGVTDGALDGVADALDGATDSALEGIADSADAADSLEFGGGFLAGAVDMPKSFFLTIFSIFGWFFTFFGMRHLPDVLGLAAQGVMVVIVVGMISVVMAVGATIAALIPLARFFRLEKATRNQDLIGRICVVTTLKVTPKFGQAEVEGSSLLVQVRADEPNPLTLDSRALIFSYDEEKGAFQVSPVGDNELSPS